MRRERRIARRGAEDANRRPPPNGPPRGFETSSYFPNEFEVEPGQQVAVHTVNTGVPPSGIAIMLPDGPMALKGPVKPKEDAYFVFTAPDRPGAYEFFSPLGPQRFFGMTGTMTVSEGAGASS